MSMSPATTVPNLDATRDRAFLLDTGETVVVRVERAPNQLPGGDVAVQVTPRVVDPATGATVQVAGVGAEAPTFTATIPVSAFDVAGFTLAAYLAGVIAEQAPRARAYAAALASFASIAPAAPATIEPGN